MRPQLQGRTENKAACLAALLLTCSAARAQDQAKDYILQAIQNHHRSHASFLYEYLSPEAGTTLLLRQKVHPRFGIKVRVIFPITMADTEVTDDGKILRSYSRDLNVLQTQVSPLKFEPDPEKRLNLILANYDLKLGKTGVIAGRSVQKVFIIPKHRASGKRVWHVDEEERVIMRSELIEPGRPVQRHLNVLHVKFHPKDKRADYRLHTKSAPTIHENWGPMVITNLDEASDKIGFRPRIPLRLPYGFQVESRQLVGEKDQPFAAIRVSDGMASVTVYQWSIKLFEGKNPRGLMPDREDANGTRYSVFGNAPQAILDTILAKFLTSAARPWND
jgi:negative regulator of sigma E activity